MNIRLKPYKKDLEYSYATGVFPTLELLYHQPTEILKVLINSKASTNTGVTKIKELCQKSGIKTEIADGLIKKLAGKENCYAVGVFKKYPNRVAKNENHLVLVGIRDMGNLGTICRTMLGFDLNNLVIIKPAADIFDPKVIRASMGAVFQLNFLYFDTFGEYQRAFSHNRYLFMTNGLIKLKNVDFKKPYALVFGSEASGLDDSFQDLGTSVVIPQSEKIDSLNLSVAVGIALYKTKLQL